MNGLWTLLMFWAGVMTGFGAFAMMQISRDGDKRSRHALRALSSVAPAGH